MRFRYEGRDIVLDSYPIGEDIVQVVLKDEEPQVYKLLNDVSYDQILPGPILKGVDDQGNTFHYLNVDSKVYLHYKGRSFLLKREERNLDDSGIISHEIRSPMPGKILKISKAPGESFQKGEVLVVLEAMKMENQLKSASSGRIRSIHFKEGDLVQQDSLLIELDILDNL